MTEDWADRPVPYESPSNLLLLAPGAPVRMSIEYCDSLPLLEINGIGIEAVGDDRVAFCIATAEAALSPELHREMAAHGVGARRIGDYRVKGLCRACGRPVLEGDLCADVPPGVDRVHSGLAEAYIKTVREGYVVCSGCMFGSRPEKSRDA